MAQEIIVELHVLYVCFLGKINVEIEVFWASFGTGPMQKQKKNCHYRQKQAVGAAQERHKCGFSVQIR